MTDVPRLIEHAFPLKQASIDSVHEKNVRHGHISTLHIWPARRPLAACRAALIATLLPDPSSHPRPEGLSDAQWEDEIKRRRAELCEKIGGRVVKKVERKLMPNGQVVEREKEETEGGILHWGRETENAADLEWFREEIRKAYGGRAPRVLDPFAGGGAIPLEAMRLGCEATAIDINPVAWFILKCTLEYPQKLAGQTRPLPEFILQDDEFMAEFFAKAKGYGKAATSSAMTRLHERLQKRAAATSGDPQGGLPFSSEQEEAEELQADLAWHVRAWGRWVLARARRDLAKYYPTYADFEPLKPGLPYERQPMRLVPLKDDGTADIDALNADLSIQYLADPRNARWVAKPTVAYLWARTVTCKNCRATIPLLKTRWLCKKANTRVILTMKPNADRTGVEFGIDANVPVRGGNAAQRREHDKRIGAGTMSRAGAQCPCCPTIMTSEDLRLEARSKGLGQLMTAAVVEVPSAKDYRRPTGAEEQAAEDARRDLASNPDSVPYGIPTEPIPRGGSRAGGGSPFTTHLYGMTTWSDVFTSRQLITLGAFSRLSREASNAADAGLNGDDWSNGVRALMATGLDKLADRSSTNCRWDIGYTKVSNTFTRFALPLLWDYCEANPFSDSTGSYLSCLEWVAQCTSRTASALADAPRCEVGLRSALTLTERGSLDLVVTDPPYYDAIPYSDLMDFFYVWLKRTLRGASAGLQAGTESELAPKWSDEEQDGELIDDASRHQGDQARSKSTYEMGMARVFVRCCDALRPKGRMVIVFAHKHPDAWETLVSALIRAGFVVDGSWPIQTEMGNRTRALAGAALASSVWLVCRKRPVTARPGWDAAVLEEMRKNIARQLREFWDAGIRGPDFVWAATGPALEAYSKYPVVRKADHPDEVMSVSEFLTHVRRFVVDFVVGRVLSGDGDGSDQGAADRLDETTAYYLLHRHDFGLDEAPAGTCILYAVSCGLSDRELTDSWDILARTADPRDRDDDDDDDRDDRPHDEDDGQEQQSGSKLRLKAWSHRRGTSMGFEAPGGRPVPLIDRIHRLMHLWKAQDVQKVNDYLDDNALRRHELFKRLLQSLIELSPRASEERSLLESLSNHVGARGARVESERALPLEE